MTRKRRRLIALGIGLSLLAAATALVLAAFNENLVFFYSPSDLAEKAIGPDRRIRIGGLVEPQSLRRQANGHGIDFRVTDGRTTLVVIYDGVLPDLLREGQGVVAEGRLRENGVFAATSVLAKHDENYMPPEVADALKKAGRWQEGATQGAVPAAAATR
ncbi:MAG TPA: cytochrome c maturation protein CcmE [Stellaceae bacterium]|nr:cytochrome c maturation protein CcmE [Stellaceae bacterium]